MTDGVKPELGSLEHYGVLGMKWGRTRARGDAYDIRTARASVVGKNAKYQQQLRRAGKIKDQGERALALDAAKKVKAANLNDPDRVLAARLTRGEKLVSAILLTPLGAGVLIGSTSAYSRRIERKQEKGKYDES